MCEIWREIPGFEGFYQISSERRVKSVERDVIQKSGRTFHCKEKIRKQSIMKTGYYGVTLRKPGILKLYTVHKLFGDAFPELIQGEWFPGAEIDHINGIKTDNRPENLRWVSHKGNMNNENTKDKMSSSMNGRPAPNRKWVIKLSKNNEILHFYPSIMQAGKENGINYKNIHSAINGIGRHKTAGGYKWVYAE